MCEMLAAISVDSAAQIRGVILHVNRPPCKETKHTIAGDYLVTIVFLDVGAPVGSEVPIPVLRNHISIARHGNGSVGLTFLLVCLSIFGGGRMHGTLFCSPVLC